MAAVTKPRPQRTAALTQLVAELAGGERVVASGIDWPTYGELLAARDGRRAAVRIVYDRGEVELMTTSFAHESWKSLLNTLVVALVEETGGVYAAGGQMTIRREDLDRGFEPDDCFYLTNAHRVLPPPAARLRRRSAAGPRRRDRALADGRRPVADLCRVSHPGSVAV